MSFFVVVSLHDHFSSLNEFFFLSFGEGANDSWRGSFLRSDVFEDFPECLPLMLVFIAIVS